MNIALLGYGKMGKLIGELAEERGHQIIAKIDLENQELRNSLDPKTIDVAIEFSQPEAAIENIRWAITHGIPVLSGTTGWLSQLSEIEALTHQHQGTFFYASNFSIGVNVFFKVNELLAKLMNETNGYQVAVEEIHHTAKKDAPSGTAITLAEGILKHYSHLKAWNLVGESPSSPSYTSAIDDLEIIHTAHSRQGFALGAIQVAEWILGKKGVLSMDDYLSF
jgi:4-hydroxy-tetrahydrodipicolinate reductase